jgi:8-oxo-dGTP pyrophosphatase MutT (NUDIX family)
MPYAYAVVWTNGGGARHVLLATKRFTGSRFAGAPVAPPVLLHGAGQACFPGGLINVGEAAQAAALREFHEETGVDLAAPLAVAAYHVAHLHLINRVGYSTLYVQLAALADLNQLVADINANIALNVPLDQEQDQVQVVAEVNVAALLGPSALIPVAGWYPPPRMAQLVGAFSIHQVGVGWHGVAAGFVPPHLRVMVTNELNAPSNWHLAGVNDLHLAAAAALVVAAALVAGPVVVPVVPILLPAMVGGPLPIAAPGHLGQARQQAFFLMAVLAVGLAVALAMLRHVYPDSSQR